MIQLEGGGFSCTFVLVHPHELAQEGEEERHRHDKGQYIGDGLADLNADQTKEPGQGEDEGDKEDTLTAAGEERCPAGLADALEQHVRGDDDRLQENCKALIMECRQSDGCYFGVVTEQADQSFAIHPAGGDDDGQETETRQHGKDAGLLDPAVFPCAVVETGHRLKSLTGADGDRDDEHENTGDDAHTGNSGVTITPGGNVQQHTADAVQTLTAKTGKTGEENGAELLRAACDRRNLKLADGFSTKEHRKQDAEADGLTQSRCDAGTGSSQSKAKDKYRVKDHIQHAAGHETDHSEAGLALVAKDVVHDKAGHHERSSNEDRPCIGAGVGQDRLGAAQHHHEMGQGHKTGDGEDQTEQQGGEEAGRSKPGSGFCVLAAKAPADDASGTVAQHKTQSLDDSHQAGNNADRTGRAGGDLTDEEGIRQIVDAGDEHTQDGGRGETQDQFWDRRLGHFSELLVAAVIGVHGQNLTFAFKHRKAALLHVKER